MQLSLRKKKSLRTRKNEDVTLEDFSFLATPGACGSSQDKDQTHATAAT